MVAQKKTKDISFTADLPLIAMFSQKKVA